MKTVLLISRNLPPLIGGMERLIFHVACELNKEYEVIVVGPEGCGKHLPPDITVHEVSLKSLPIFLIEIFITSISASRNKKIDIVFAGSGLVALPVFFLSKLSNSATIAYIHGLDMEVDSVIYKKIWFPIFRRLDLVIANSNFSKKLTLGAGVKEDRVIVLHPGVSIPDWSKKEIKHRKFRDTFNLGDSPLMLYVGRITARKGLLPFVDKIMPTIIDRVPEAKLVVIGDEPDKSLLKNSGIMSKIHQKIDELGLRKQIIFAGRVDQNDPLLSEAYFAADVLIFPVQAIPGDNEGFGMVAIEAAAHGVPTLVFNAGGVSDAVQNGVSGFVIDKDDFDGFAVKAIEVLQHKRKLDSHIIKEHAKKYAWPSFGERLRKAVNVVLK